MCGRYTLTNVEAKLTKMLRLQQLAGLKARYNIAPTQPIAAVRANEQSGEREWAIFSWGLVPFWAKEPSIAHKMLNARAETAAGKPAFRGPMRHHRCLIPADGFYEWKGRAGQKQPFYFRRRDHEPFCFAGLFDHWGSPDGSEIESATILTTSANDFMKPVHHRMPVIIQPKDYDRWMDPKIQRSDAVADLLHAPPEDFFIREPVTPLVNNVRNEVPECIMPTVEPPEPPAQMGFGF
ncbi:SOS response-associated peptidase [Cerasicoccus fimbriatus]|uniref:SOS response-associated peptidase n=1 Tax=Cerasicoccus fimbriatus TaxID=3014554 RepID=UPI0022B380D4|nr:SOS response-associated peptidase [Cerasicoccus sp. TK19100]